MINDVQGVCILIDTPAFPFECQSSLIKIIQADRTPWVSNHLNVSILPATGENSFSNIICVSLEILHSLLIKILILYLLLLHTYKFLKIKF